MRTHAPVIALLVVLAAFALRTFGLGRVEIGGDEAFTYDFITRSVEDIVRATLDIGEPHPIGSYVVFKAAMALFGESEFALRYASVLSGVMAVAMAGRLARWAADPPAARTAQLIAMGAMAVSPFAVYHSRELRMYALTLALSLAATLAAVAAWRTGRGRWLFAYATATWLGLHMHYYFVATIAALNAGWLVALVFDPARVRQRFGWLAAQAATATLYAPWLAVAGGILGTYRGNMASPDIASATQYALAGVLTGGIVKSMAGPIVTAIAAAGVAATAALGARRLGSCSRSRTVTTTMLALCMILPLALVVGASLSRPIFRERYFVAALGPFCVLCAGAIAAQPRRAVAVATAVPVAAGMLAGTTFLLGEWNARTPDWRTLAATARRFTASSPDAQARVVLNYPDPAFSYYYRGSSPFTVLPPAAGDEAGTARAVQSFADQGVQRVVLQLVPSFWDDREIVKRALETRFNKVEETYTGRWIVQVYARRAFDDLPRLGAVFDGRVSLARADARLDASQRFVEVALAWQASGAGLAGGEKVFLHVSDSRDPARLVGQLDLGLTDAELRRDVNVYGVRLADPLPAGEYVVRMGLYTSAAASFPRLRTADGQDAIILASFTAP